MRDGRLAVDHVGDADDFHVAVAADLDAHVCEDEDAVGRPEDLLDALAGVAAGEDLYRDDARAERREGRGVVQVGPQGAGAGKAADLRTDVGVPHVGEPEVVEQGPLGERVALGGLC